MNDSVSQLSNIISETSTNKDIEKFYNEIIKKEEINKLKPIDFPTNLSKELVQDYFLKAIETINLDLVEYLINTNKNYSQPNFKDYKLINLLNNIQLSFGTINKDLIFKYIFSKNEFKETISYDLAKRVIQGAITDNYMPIIKASLDKPEFLEHFQTFKCFAKACEHGNIELLDIYFNNEEKYWLGSKEVNMRLSVTEAVKHKQYDTLFYLLNVRHIEVTEQIKIICQRTEESQQILRDYLLYINIDDKINNGKEVINKLKKKI